MSDELVTLWPEDVWVLARDSRVGDLVVVAGVWDALEEDPIEGKIVRESGDRWVVVFNDEPGAEWEYPKHRVFALPESPED